MELISPKKLRVRVPRRIDVRNQIKIYDEDLAIINHLLNKINIKLFSDQQIRFYAVLPTIDKNGEIIENKISLLVITNEYIIYL